MTIRIQLGGDVAALRRAFNNPKRIEIAIRKAVRVEAHWMRAQMVKGLKSGSPAGKQLKPNAPSTVMMKGSSKPLIASATMLNSISVIPKGKGVFIGIKRSTKRGINLALLHERGAVIKQTVTRKQRKFFLFLSSKMFGKSFAPKIGAQIEIKIPARPFISPVVEKEAPTLQLRIAKSFAKQIGDMGSP